MSSSSTRSQKHALELVPQDSSRAAVTSGEIPSCLFPLRTTKAQAEYESLAQILWQAGQLTIDRYRVLSEYALQFDCLHVSLDEGLTIRPSRFDQLKRARRALRLRDLDLSKPEEVRRPNKFARSGFSSSRRQLQSPGSNGRTGSPYP